MSPKKTTDLVSKSKHNDDPEEEENIANTELRILRDAHKIIYDRNERSKTNPRIKLKSFIDYTHVIELINDRNAPVLAKIPRIAKEHEDFAHQLRHIQVETQKMNDRLATYGNKFRETEQVIHKFQLLGMRLDNERDDLVEYKK